MIANKQTADAKLESLNVWSQVTAFVHTYSPCWGTQAQPSQIEDLPNNIDKERNQIDLRDVLMKIRVCIH